MLFKYSYFLNIPSLNQVLQAAIKIVALSTNSNRFTKAPVRFWLAKFSVCPVLTLSLILSFHLYCHIGTPYILLIFHTCCFSFILEKLLVCYDTHGPLTKKPWPYHENDHHIFWSLLILTHDMKHVTACKNPFTTFHLLFQEYH